MTERSNSYEMGLRRSEETEDAFLQSLLNTFGQELFSPAEIKNTKLSSTGNIPKIQMINNLLERDLLKTVSVKGVRFYQIIKK